MDLNENNLLLILIDPNADCINWAKPEFVVIQEFKKKGGGIKIPKNARSIVIDNELAIKDRDWVRSFESEARQLGIRDIGKRKIEQIEGMLNNILKHQSHSSGSSGAVSAGVVKIIPRSDDIATLKPTQQELRIEATPKSSVPVIPYGPPNKTTNGNGKNAIVVVDPPRGAKIAALREEFAKIGYEGSLTIETARRIKADIFAKHGIEIGEASIITQYSSEKAKVMGHRKAQEQVVASSKPIPSNGNHIVSEHDIQQSQIAALALNIISECEGLNVGHIHCIDRLASVKRLARMIITLVDTKAEV